MPKPNLTLPTGLVLQAIALGIRHGFDIMEATGLPSGTVYPALRRLEGVGCLMSEWEGAEESEAEGRPPRCYYTLTPAGNALLGQAVRRFPAIRLAVSGPGARTGWNSALSKGNSGIGGGRTPKPGTA